MKGINAKSVLRSAERLVEGEEHYKETGEPVWILFLKKESSILVRRAVKVWLNLRFRRV